MPSALEAVRVRRRRARPADSPACGDRCRPCRCRTSAASDRAASRRHPACRASSREAREERHVVGVDLRGLGDLLGIELVVRHACDGRRARQSTDTARPLSSREIWNATTRVTSAWIGEQVQVEHQLRVIVERIGDADRLLGERQARAVGAHLGALNPLLDVADRGQILVDRLAIACARVASADAPCPASRGRGRCDPAAVARRARPRVPPSPNSRSNTARGLLSIGIGVVGVFHEKVRW